jgi:hypothetical protein
MVYSTGFIVGYEVGSFHMGQMFDIVTQWTWVKAQQVLSSHWGRLQKRCLGLPKTQYSGV